MAHRTTPWASGRTTTDPQETPGRHLPGGPTTRHTGDTLSTGRKARYDTPAEVAEVQVCMLKGAHAYNRLSWVLLEFATFVLAVAYTLQVPPSLSFSCHRCTSTLGGSTPAMRRLSLAGARSACKRERPCHSVGHPDVAGLISFFQTPL